MQSTSSVPFFTLDAVRAATGCAKSELSIREAACKLFEKNGESSFFVFDPCACNVVGVVQFEKNTVIAEFEPYDALRGGLKVFPALKVAYRNTLTQQLEGINVSTTDELKHLLETIRISAAVQARGMELSPETIEEMVKRESAHFPIKIDTLTMEAKKSPKVDEGELLDLIADSFVSRKASSLRWQHSAPPPNIRAVARMNDLLLCCAFTGYFGAGNGFDRPKNQLLVRRTKEALLNQLEYAIAFGVSGCTKENARNRAEKIANDFFMQFPTVRSKIVCDVQHAFNGDPAAGSQEECILTSPGIRAISIYRFANVLLQLKVPLIPRMMTEHIHSKYGIDIHPGATIGSGCFIDHGTGVVIGQTTVIGMNVRIYQGVTLGALTFDLDEQGNLKQRGAEYKRHPTIGDNVIIYANASILGGETFVGANSVIGANVRLTKSVLPESLVTMPIVKPRIRYAADDCEDGSSI